MKKKIDTALIMVPALWKSEDEEMERKSEEQKKKLDNLLYKHNFQVKIVTPINYSGYVFLHYVLEKK